MLDDDETWELGAFIGLRGDAHKYIRWHRLTAFLKNAAEKEEPQPQNKRGKFFILED
ncbi:MAG: hypothetical protein FWB75_06045 [Oscillospiraceae bacterium]|nr:hypothetical protein [Oscillospiraceae bacterium]